MDPRNFRSLALAEYAAVDRLARYLAPRLQDADDLVQETFLRAFRSAASFQLRPDRGIRPWLFRILNNVAKDRSAAEQQRTQLADSLRSQLADASAADPHHGAASFDRPALASLSELNWDGVDERLKLAIGELATHLRTPFLLYAAGLQYREIAEVIEAPIGTVMSRLYRARQLLTARLASLAADRGLSRARPRGLPKNRDVLAAETSPPTNAGWGDTEGDPHHA